METTIPEACKSNKKLLTGDLVEVRQKEKGLRGSWHPGVVFKVKPGRRLVKYDELLTMDGADKLIESIPVARSLDGAKVPARLSSNQPSKKERGFIRPRPPPYPHVPPERWKRGLWVDAFFDDAWWEGVMVEDLVDSDLSRVVIYFPDEADEATVPFTGLRIAQEWDEESCLWRLKGFSDFYKNGKSLDSVPNNEEVKAHILDPNHLVLDCHENNHPADNHDINHAADNHENNYPADNRVNLIDSHIANIQTKACLFCFQSVKDVILTKDIAEDVSLSKDLTEDVDLSKNVTEVVISTEGANLSKDTVEDVNLAEGIAEDVNMSEAIIEDVNLAKNINMAEDIAEGINLFADVAEGATLPKYIAEGVNLPEYFSADTNLLEDISEDLKLSNGRTEHRNLSEDMVKDVNDMTQEIKKAENLTDDANLIEDVNFPESITENVTLSGDITEDINTSKDVSENETLADWMKLEKLSVVEMKKRFSSASCSTIIPISERHFKVRRGNGRGRVQGQGRGGLQKNVLSRSVGSTSAVESSCLRGQLTSQTGVKLEHNETVHGEHDERNFSAKVASSRDMTQATWLSPKILKEARDRAKKILQRAGYTIRFRARMGKSKEEAYYVSPEGRAYYSLLSACNNWKLHSSLPVSTEESQTMQLVSMYRLTKNFTHDHDPCKRDKASRLDHKHSNQSKVGCIGSSGQTLEGSGSVLNVFDIDMLKLPKVDGAAQDMKMKMVKQQLMSCKSSFSGELRHWKRRLRWLSNTRKRKRQELDQDLAENLKHTENSENGNKGQILKNTTCQLHSSRCLEVLLSPPVHGKVDDDSIGAHALSKRTILSWLIDLAVVEENEKVQYMSKNDGHLMLEGWVTREGILCNCCNTILSVSVFAAHAGSKLRRPSANIRLNDGRSLLDCQIQALNVQGAPKKLSRSEQNDLDESDDTCGVCGDGGELVCCDHCPSTFHFTCINLEFQDVPEGEWYCPNCRCTLCGGSEFNGDRDSFDEMTILFCDQCEREYHVGCLYAKGVAKMDHCPKGSWFCGSQCEEIFQGLRGLVGTTHVLEDGFSCVFLRSAEEDNEGSIVSNLEVDVECNSKLALALSVMQECFRPMIDTRTQMDIISHVVYNRGADVNRLNFRGFYTVLLERDEELISVACIRVHGPRVAEMPLIGTRFQYRRQGMCRRLLNAIEEILGNLKVKTFVLPAVPELLGTWTCGFSFQSLSAAQRLELVELNILAFPGSTLLQKPLQRSSSQLIKISVEPQVVDGEGETKSGLGTTYSNSTSILPEHSEREEYEKDENLSAIQDCAYDTTLEFEQRDAKHQSMVPSVDIDEKMLLHVHSAKEVLQRGASLQVNHIGNSQYQIAKTNICDYSNILHGSEITKLAEKPVPNGQERSQDAEREMELLRHTFDFSPSNMLVKDNASLPHVQDDMFWSL